MVAGLLVRVPPLRASVSSFVKREYNFSASSEAFYEDPDALIHVKCKLGKTEGRQLTLRRGTVPLTQLSSASGMGVALFRWREAGRRRPPTGPDGDLEVSAFTARVRSPDPEGRERLS